MKNYIAILSTLLTFFSCNTESREKGNGKIVPQEHAVREFTEIAVKGNFEISLKKTNAPGINITTDENLQEFIDVSQNGEILYITAVRTLNSKKPIKITIGYTGLLAIGSSGTSVIRSDGQIKGDYLRINMAGAGTIDLNVALDALKATISGAGAVILKGKVNEQNIQMTGAGGLDAYELISQNCKIDISGVGGASINVKNKLEATVSGVGGISYKGNPQEVVSDISGLGTIKNAEKTEEG